MSDLELRDELQEAVSLAHHYGQRNEKLEQVMGEMQTILEKHVCYDGDPDHCFACRCLLRLRTKNDGDSLQGVEQ